MLLKDTFELLLYDWFGLIAPIVQNPASLQPWENTYAKGKTDKKENKNNIRIKYILL
jgi:hypothetical protein